METTHVRMERAMLPGGGPGPVRALWVYHFPIFGGPHNLALRLAEPLRAMNVETSVVITDEPGDASKRIAAAEVPIAEIPLRRLRAVSDLRVHLGFASSFPGDVARLRRVIREHEADVVIVTGLVNPHAAVAAKLERKPVVWQIVDTRAPPLLRRAATQVVHALADSVMYNGQALAQLHTGARGVPNPVILFFQTVDTDRFRPSQDVRESVRRRLGIPLDAPLVGSVANINPQKGIEYFVRAAALIHRVRPDAWFLAWGADYESHRDYRRSLDEVAARAGLARDRLIFHYEPIDPPYPALDVKLITSVPRSEGTTTTASEAMACGVPVVASDVGAVREVVEHGVTGLMVPPLQPNALAAAALRILGDKELATRFARAGRERVVERYGLEACASLHVAAIDAALKRARGEMRAPSPSETGAPHPDLVELLACPACRDRLSATAGWLECAGCGRRYPVVDGIPICRVQDAEAASDDDQAEELGRRRELFDRGVGSDSEIYPPEGTPRLYRWLMREKFRRSVAGLEALLPDSTVLSVCAGSETDAEFLGRRCARVIAADFSLGAARRAQQWARRYDVPILPLVADPEALPFADRAIDIAYVHDGLHRLREPVTGVLEMARVSDKAVSINEPVNATVTRLAMRLGIAHEREAGIRVARSNPGELTRVLRRRGFDVFGANRYAMFYRRYPTSAMRVMSAPGVLPVVLAGFLSVNRVLGRHGNKLALRATRVSEHPVRDE